MRNTIAPIASGLNALRDQYFAALTSYRQSHAAPLVGLMALSARVGGEEGRMSIERIKHMPAEWLEAIDARPGSTAARLVATLHTNPS